MRRRTFYYDDRSALTRAPDPGNGLTYCTCAVGSRLTSAKDPCGGAAHRDYGPPGP